MNLPNDLETIELRIAEVVAGWMALGNAQRPTANELVAQHPDLAPGLEECVQSLLRIERNKPTLIDQGAEVSLVDRPATAYPQIPDFEIQRELGRGGMGIVYEAKQVSLGRVVALKVLPIGKVEPRSVQRFVKEAETVAKLDHPHIVPIYAVGVHNGLNWFAMQRIDGCPLSEWFASNTFESRHEAIREVIRVGIEAAEALEHAHQRGVIHRDVKPGNLLVDTNRKVWLTDFGLARREVDVTATATGAMLGTPRYMSSEQVSGRDGTIDARTDVYSLGATLFEMATGRPPFTSESPLELLMQIQSDEPTGPRQIDPLIPRALELVILKCLDKEPSRRYASAATLANDLKSIRDDRPISARGLPVWVSAARFLKRNELQLNAVATATIATVGILGTLGLFWQQSKRDHVGSVRIKTPAGLYVANIQPDLNTKNLSGTAAGASMLRKSEIPATLVTTPMQQTMELAAGKYLARLEGVGKPSQTVELNVKAQELLEFDYIDRREPIPEVDIYKKLCVSIAGNELAVLGLDSLEVFDSGGVRRLVVSVHELDSGLVEELPADLPNPQYRLDDDPPLTFAFNPESTFQGDFEVAHTGFARIQRMSASQPDLDGDQQPDLLLTAARHAAIAAVSHDGSVLWKRRLAMSFESGSSRSPYSKNKMPNEAIVGITTVDDLNADGTGDLVVNAALFDPSGFSRPMVFTLSGQDGSDIAVAAMPTIDMNKNLNWPWAGLLRHRRGFNVDTRANRYVNTYFDRHAKRSSGTDLNCERWNGNSANSALYVLPPMVLGKYQGDPIAALAMDQTIQFMNIANGQLVGSPIPLSNPICRGPIGVKMSNGRLGVMAMTGIPGNAWTKCFLTLCVLGESKPRWSETMDLSACDLVIGAADSSLPLAVDLDSDGTDEIIATANTDHYTQWPKLLCFSSETGSLRWSSLGIAGISTVVERILTVGDIDRDGTIDLAILGTTARPRTVNSNQSDGLRLNVDFISGSTGRRLGYREERISGENVDYRVIEIDSAELSGNKLICSVVYGDVEELELNSVTVTINLQQLASTDVARGLTVLSVPGATAEPNNGRWYRRRSGPFARPSDSAVWIDRSPKQSWFPGESLIASWNSAGKRPRSLLSDSSGAVRCVDLIDGSVLWKQARFFFNHNTAFCIPGAQGQTDLLINRNANGGPAFYDAETGSLRFEINSPPMGEIHYIDADEVSPERFVYALADARFKAPGTLGALGLRSNQGYLLLKIDRTAERLVWSKPCYSQLNASRSSHQPSKMLQIDINGDGETDLITADTDSNTDKVLLQAINGSNGQTFWSMPLELKVNDQSWPMKVSWPLTTIVSSGSRKFLLAIDAVSSDEKAIDLKAIDLRDGTVLSSIQITGAHSLTHEAQTKALSLRPISQTKRDGLVGISKLKMDSSKCTWTVLRVAENSGAITEVDRFDAYLTQFAPDIDQDGVIDRIDVANHRTVEVRRGDTNEAIGTFELPENLQIRRVETIGAKTYLVGFERDKEHYWLELPSGRVAAHFGLGLQAMTHNQTEYPRMLQHLQGTHLIGTTREGPMCLEIEFGEKATRSSSLEKASVAMVSPSADPRYKRAVTATGIYASQTLGRVVWLALLATGAILLPIVYVFSMIRQRQSSLRQLLLAPVVTLLALIAWREFSQQPFGFRSTDVIVGGLTSISLLVLYTVLRHQQWKLLGLGVLFSVIAGTLFMLGAISSIAQQIPGVVGYWTLSNWLTAIPAAGAQLIAPSMMLWYISQVFFPEKRNREQRTWFFQILNSRGR